MEELRSVAATLGDRVHLVGHQDDIALWFAMGDVIAMPSLREAFGFAALEAMAGGKPLVASEVGGLAEAVGREGAGILVPPNDPEALAGALAELLLDPSARRQLGEVARARYEHYFTLDRMAAATAWAISRPIASTRAGGAVSSSSFLSSSAGAPRASGKCGPSYA